MGSKMGRRVTTGTAGTPLLAATRRARAAPDRTPRILPTSDLASLDRAVSPTAHVRDRGVSADPVSWGVETP